MGLGCSRKLDRHIFIFCKHFFADKCFYYLQILYDALESAEPIPLELDRNLQVLFPSQAAKQVDLPPVFFSMTPEELKREQQMRFV